MGLLPTVLSRAVPSRNLHLDLDLEGRLLFNPEASGSYLSPLWAHTHFLTTSSLLPLFPRPFLYHTCSLPDTGSRACCRE